MTKKPYTLKANTKNLLSDCVGIIMQMLEHKKGTKCFDSFEETFEYFKERVSIPPTLRKIVDRGTPKWQQAIRNAAKVHRDKQKPDALTQGELMALVHGGFALPDHVPDDRETVEFPQLGGFKIKKKIIRKKEVNPLSDVTFWADIIDHILDRTPDHETAQGVVLELAARYDFEVQ